MMQRVEITKKLDDGRYQVVLSGVDPRNVENGLGDYTPEFKEKTVTGYIQQIGDDPDDFILVAIDDGVSSITKEGERRIYSVSGGIVKASILLDVDGNIVMNEGSDFAVRFSELETAFNDLQNMFNTHIHVTTATVGPTAVPGVISVTTAQSTGQISLAKIDTIKVP